MSDAFLNILNDRAARARAVESLRQREATAREAARLAAMRADATTWCDAVKARLATIHPYLATGTMIPSFANEKATVVHVEILVNGKTVVLAVYRDHDEVLKVGEWETGTGRCFRTVGSGTVRFDDTDGVLLRIATVAGLYREEEV